MLDRSEGGGGSYIGELGGPLWRQMAPGPHAEIFDRAGAGRRHYP